jgi:ribonuclease P protein component
MSSHLSFPSTARLRTKLQYDAVREKGKTRSGPFFRLSALDVNPLECLQQPAQCGFIVSRRVGNAVVRNRVKRRLRELYRYERPHVLPGLWLVFIATPQAATATLTQLRDEWHRLSKKLSLFQKK